MFLFQVKQLEEVPIFSFEVPQKRDGREVFDFINACPPLDVNSRYAYFLLCDHFANTSLICRNIDKSEEIAGFIGGYRKPTEPETLFVWQIAVDEKCRGHRLSHMMLDRLLQVQNPVPIKTIEATYTPSNKASFHFFQSFAKDKNAQVEIDAYLSEEDFDAPKTGHEAERRIRIFLPDRSSQ